MIEEKACCDDRNPAVELDDVVNLWKKFKNKIASIKKRMILGKFYFAAEHCETV